jgi:hypothetical protein
MLPTGLDSQRVLSFKQWCALNGISVRDSPTFVATFDDGEVTRMTVYQGREDGRLDVERGVRLAQWAYRSRMKLECDPRKPADTPAIVEARYEARCKDGEGEYVVLETYTAEELATLTADLAPTLQE